MAKGKKYDNETLYKIMISVFSTNNYNETAKCLKLPESTVRTIYEKNIVKKEFVKLKKEKEQVFISKADDIIDKAIDLLNKRLATALNRHEEIELLLDQIYDVSEDDMKVKEKLEIAKKLSRIQLQSLSEITTALGTVYDKRALAQGKATNNIGYVKLEDIL